LCYDGDLAQGEDMTRGGFLVNTVVAATLGLALLLPGTARAGGVTVEGGNTDFNDLTLVMPYSAVGNRISFLSISNCCDGAFRARWTFFDESGQQIDEIQRDVAPYGTDVVDVTAIRDRTISGDSIQEGPARSLAGRQGFVVVRGDEQAPRLLGNFTIANTSSSAAFGASATGLGFVGSLQQGGFLLGTSFDPTTLQDSLLIVIALNWPEITSLTNGGPPPEQPLFNLAVELDGPTGNVVAQGTIPIRGTATFTTLSQLFPGAALNSSLSIALRGTEGPGYAGSALDPDGDDGVAIIGYYGQAVGPFGAGQNLRAGIFDLQ